MRILIVARYKQGRFAPFVAEQAEALQQAGCEVVWFGVQSKGVSGYLRALPRLRKALRSTRPDVVHAHYGLCGLLANMATRRVPVVTTYHGSDMNVRSVRPFSRLAIGLSAWNIFVNGEWAKGRKASVIPCGVNVGTAKGGETKSKRDKGRVLFAGAFDDMVKNAALAFEAMSGIDAELVELKGYTREEVNRLLSEVRCLLMTSQSEGSPQIIKEAMVCGCPIVSVDVGDVKERIEGVNNCYIVPREPRAIREAIRKVTAERTNGQEKIIADGLTNEQVANKIMDVYARVMR